MITDWVLYNWDSSCIHGGGHLLWQWTDWDCHIYPGNEALVEATDCTGSGNLTCTLVAQEAAGQPTKIEVDLQNIHGHNSWFVNAFPGDLT